MLQLKWSCDKRMFFYFYNQISFSFSFSRTCLMGTFKKTECNPICKVFTKVFSVLRIPYHSSNSFSSKGERNLATVVAGSLTDWISVVTINWPAQAKFLFKALNNLKFREYAVKILYCNTHISGCFIILSFKRLSTLNTVWSLKFSNDFYIINIVPLNNVHKQNTNHNDCQNSIFVQKRDNL